MNKRDKLLLQRGCINGVQFTLSILLALAEKEGGRFSASVKVLVTAATKRMQELGLLKEDFTPIDTLHQSMEVLGGGEGSGK